MLTGTCVGTIEYQSIIEPIRSSNEFVDYLEGEVIDIDKNSKKIIAKLPKVQYYNESMKNFTVGYDHLVVACGVMNSDFGLEGVSKYCHFLKEISDSRAIKQNIIDCFELATIPEIPESEVERLLTFVTVGGGPTGVEFMGELSDFVFQDVGRLYPRLQKKVRLILVNAGAKLLNSFDRYNHSIL